jgi:hypothetical protein
MLETMVTTWIVFQLLAPRAINTRFSTRLNAASFEERHQRRNPMAGSSGRQKAASRPTKASKRVPVEKFICGERTPLEHLLALMNDSSLPPMRSQAIARRLAPYFHAKLKPISAREGLVTAADEKAAEGGSAEDSGLLREQIRQKIFSSGY